MGSAARDHNVPSATALVRDGESLPVRLQRNAERYGGCLALREERHGQYRTWSWRELEARVEGVSRGLSMLEFGPGSLLLTLGDLSPEWAASVLAAQRLGGTVLPLSCSASDEELKTAAALTRPRFVLAQGARELERLRGLGQLLAPDVRPLLIEPPGADLASEAAPHSVEELGSLGEGSGATDPRCTHVLLVPAFISFVRRTDGHIERHALYHSALLAGAKDAQLALSEDDELWLDPTLSFGVERLLGFSAWLSAASSLSIAG